MHTDNRKVFDRRNIEGNVRRGIVSRRDYEAYLSKLPDVSDKIAAPEEQDGQEGDGKSRKSDQGLLEGKRIPKRKGKGQ